MAKTKALPKVWKEDQIFRVFQSSYDQPTDLKDDINSWESLPNRYLSRWYLVQPKPRLSLRELEEQKKQQPRRGRPKVQNHSTFFSRCPRVALPESGKFQPNVVLYGWLRPNNNNGKHPMILVCISDLDRWVINRSKEERGYWIFSQKGSYWLQDPCTHKVPLYSRLCAAKKKAVTESNEKDSMNNATKRRLEIQDNSHGGVTSASENNDKEAAAGKENFVEDNAKNATTAATTTRKASTKNTKRLASQADVHLQHRLRLGLLSVLLEDLEIKNDKEVERVSQFRPQKFLASLKRQQTLEEGTADETQSKRIFDWKLWQPHGHFIGSHLLLYHVSLSVLCPLLLGLFGRGERCDGLNYEFDSETSGSGRKRQLSQERNPHCTPKIMLELALQAEEKIQQTPWGQPISVMSTQIPEQSFEINSNSSTKDTQASTATRLGIKEDKPRGRGRPRKYPRLGLKDSSNEKRIVTDKDLSMLGPLKKQIQEPASNGPKTPKATIERDAENSAVRPPSGTPAKRSNVGTPAKNAATGILRTPIKGVPDSHLKQKRVKFHHGVIPRRKAGDDDVSVGSRMNEPIVVDSDTDESDEASHQEDQQQQYAGPIFRFRRRTEVVALCVHARDLSISMKEVVEKATEFGESDKVGVFQWSPDDKKRLREGKLNLLFRVGLMSFTKDHFETLTAQDTVDIAPLTPNPVAALTDELHLQQPSKVDIEVCLNPAY